MGFEPTRGDPNGLAVHRLNHSATSSWQNPIFIMISFMTCEQFGGKSTLEGFSDQDRMGKLSFACYIFVVLVFHAFSAIKLCTTIAAT